MEREYNKDLNTYFQLKAAYETKYKQRVRSITKRDDLTNKQKRAKVRKIKMKCIGCKRNVGTIFSNKNNTYSAVCGDKEDACPLDISLKRGIYVHLPTEIATLQKTIQDVEINIIYTKLDLLFGFINEEEMLQEFEEQKEYHKIDTNNSDTFKQIYKLLLNKEERNTTEKTAIENKYTFLQEYETEISEYLATDNVQVIHDSIASYIDVLIPILRDIADNKYMERYVEVEASKQKELGKRILIQKPQILAYEGLNIEEPVVQSFVLS